MSGSRARPASAAPTSPPVSPGPPRQLPAGGRALPAPPRPSSGADGSLLSPQASSGSWPCTWWWDTARPCSATSSASPTPPTSRECRDSCRPRRTAVPGATRRWSCKIASLGEVPSRSGVASRDRAPKCWFCRPPLAWAGTGGR